MEEIWKSEHSLSEFTDPKNFKSYSDLKEKLDRVLGKQTDTPTPTDVPFDGGKPMTPAQAAVKPPVTETHVATAATAETEDDMSYFKQLAED